VNCKCAKGTSNANYSRQLLKAIERVGGLVTSDEYVRKLMLDREAWRSRIKMIVSKNKRVDASKREDSKIRRINTRSAIVVI
jgi:type IV secretory pathway VirD2 relaxase